MAVRNSRAQSRKVSSRVSISLDKKPDSNPLVEGKLDKWINNQLKDLPGNKDYEEERAKRLQRHRDLDAEIKIAQENMINKQSAVAYAIDCVKDRVSDIVHEYNVWMKMKEDGAAEKVKLNNMQMEDGTFKYHVAIDNMEWKNSLKFLHPKFRPLATQFEDTIEKVPIIDLKMRLKLFLNDYRRMYLHTTFIKENDPSPRYLDEIKLWIKEASAEDPGEGDVAVSDEAMAKRMEEIDAIRDGALQRFAEHEELQSRVLEVRNHFKSTAAIFKGKLIADYHHLNAIVDASTVKPDLSVFEHVSRTEQYEYFKNILEKVELEADIAEEVKETLLRKNSELLRIDAKIQEADKFVAELQTNTNKIKERSIKFLKELTKPMEGILDPIFRTFSDMRDKEKEDVQLMKECQKETEQTGQQIKKFQPNLAKEKLSPFSLLGDPSNSNMAKKCSNPGLVDLYTSVVAALSAYSDVINPMYQRQLERLQDIQKKQGRCMPSFYSGDSIVEVYNLFKEDRGEVSANTKPRLFFKIHENVMQELGRLVSDSHSISTDITLDEMEKCKLELELACIAAPLLIKQKEEPPPALKDKKKSIVPTKTFQEKSKAKKSIIKKPSVEMPLPPLKQSIKPSPSNASASSLSSKLSTKGSDIGKKLTAKGSADVSKKLATKVSAEGKIAKIQDDTSAKTQDDTSSKVSKKSKTDPPKKGQGKKGSKTPSAPSSRRSSFNKNEKTANTDKTATSSSGELRPDGTTTETQKRGSASDSGHDKFIPSNVTPEEFNVMADLASELLDELQSHHESVAISHGKRVLKKDLLSVSSSEVNVIDLDERLIGLQGKKSVVYFEMLERVMSIESENEKDKNLMTDIFDLYKSEWEKENPDQDFNEFAQNQTGIWSKLTKLGNMYNKRKSSGWNPLLVEPDWVRKPTRPPGTEFVCFLNSRPVYRDVHGQYMDHDGVYIQGDALAQCSTRVCYSRLQGDGLTLQRPDIGLLKGSRFGPKHDPCAKLDLFNSQMSNPVLPKLKINDESRVNSKIGFAVKKGARKPKSRGKHI